jgi:TonB family protein
MWLLFIGAVVAFFLSLAVISTGVGANAAALEDHHYRALVCLAFLYWGFLYSALNKGLWKVNVRGTARLTSAAIGEVLNRVCDVVIWSMSANAIFQQQPALFAEDCATIRGEPMKKAPAGAALAATILVAFTSLASQSTQHDSGQPDASKVGTSNPDRKPLKVYHVGGNVKAPRPISSPQPSLDEQQVKDQSSGKKTVMAGSVIVKIVVGDDGTVISANVVQSLNRDLDARALNAVKQWKFEPAQKKGVPVAVELAVQVDFHLYKCLTLRVVPQPCSKAPILALALSGHYTQHLCVTIAVGVRVCGKRLWDSADSSGHLGHLASTRENRHVVDDRQFREMDVCGTSRASRFTTRSPGGHSSSSLELVATCSKPPAPAA